MIRSRLFAAIVLMVCFNPAYALTWEDLWLNQDQQAYNALSQNNPQQAASLFESSQWQGTAYYRMGDYQKALLAFMKANDATAWYNRGNALAHLGQYQEAIRAYDKALSLDPHFEDARFNENLLKQWLNSSGSASTPPETASEERSPPPFKQNYKNKKNNTDNNATDASPQNNTDSPAKPSPDPGSSTPTPTESTPAAATSYESQQQQQSMQNMSDDPGGLLQRKLSRDYARSQQQGD